MNDGLRVGDVDVLFIEALFDGSGHIKFQTPIVRRIAPGADGEVDRTIGEFRDHDEEFGIGMDPFVAADHVFDDIADLVDVRLIAHSKYPIDPSGIVMAEVLDGGTPNLTVRDDDMNIVRCRQFGGEKVQHLDSAGNAAGFDEVTDAERAEQNQHEPGRNIAQRALQSQADRQTDGAEDGNEARRLNAKLTEDGNDRDRQDKISRRRCGQCRDHFIDFSAATHHPQDDCFHPFGRNPADNENKDGANNIQTIGGQYINDHRCSIFNICLVHRLSPHEK